MTDDYKRGLVTGLAMQPLYVTKSTGNTATYLNGEISNTDSNTDPNRGYNIIALEGVSTSTIASALAAQVTSLMGWQKRGNNVVTPDGVVVEFSAIEESSGSITYTHLYITLWTKSRNYYSKVRVSSITNLAKRSASFIFVKSATGKSMICGIAVGSDSWLGACEVLLAYSKDADDNDILMTAGRYKEANCIGYDNSAATTYHQFMARSDFVIEANSLFSTGFEGNEGNDIKGFSRPCSFINAPSLLDGKALQELYWLMTADLSLRLDTSYCIARADGKSYHAFRFGGVNWQSATFLVPMG